MGVEVLIYHLHNTILHTPVAINSFLSGVVSKILRFRQNLENVGAGCGTWKVSKIRETHSKTLKVGRPDTRTHTLGIL